MGNYRRHTYTVDELKEAVKVSSSKRQVLLRLGIVAQGGNYASLERDIIKNNIDTSHFTGKGWNNGKTHGFKRPLEDYLSNKCFINSSRLKQRLIKEKVFSHKCSLCENTQWQNLPIPLELHHKDGNKNNNNLENLCLLCSNCHSLTDNFRGKKNKKKNKKERKKKAKFYGICFCGKPLKRRNKFCSYKCSRFHTRKVPRPTREELLILLKQNSYCEVGRRFGVSDHAIRKWLKAFEIEQKEIKDMPQIGFEPILTSS